MKLCLINTFCLGHCCCGNPNPMYSDRVPTPRIHFILLMAVNGFHKAERTSLKHAQRALFKKMLSIHDQSSDS